MSIDLFEDLIDKESEIIHYKLIVVVMVKVGGRSGRKYLCDIKMILSTK